MSEIPFQDKRGFFILPQKYEGGGYYTYGTPDQLGATTTTSMLH